MASEEEYRALVGMDFKDAEDNECRVEAGDKIVGMPEDELRHQMNVGNVEVWVDRRTQNVVKPDSANVTVHGVLSRHQNEGADIVLKAVGSVE